VECGLGWRCGGTHIPPSSVGFATIPVSGRRWTDIYEAPQAGAGDASIACVRARQAGHSPRMEEMIYGLLLTANSIATMTEQAQFRRVTIDWHRMLRFASSWIEHAVDADVEQRRQKEEQRARQRRWDRIRRIDIDATMTQLYGAGGGRIESGVRKVRSDVMYARVHRVVPRESDVGSRGLRTTGEKVGPPWKPSHRKGSRR